MMQLASEMGLHRSNVTQLEGSQIDLAGRTDWIHPDQAKAQKAIGAPLSAQAVVVLDTPLHVLQEFGRVGIAGDGPALCAPCD